jgi:hypothetical protein
MDFPFLLLLIIRFTANAAIPATTNKTTRVPIKHLLIFLLLQYEKIHLQQSSIVQLILSPALQDVRVSSRNTFYKH